MSFITYAQNCEDVILWRALGHIRNGFYIDVGANDPVEHSVTKAFYDAGWTGINIEPLPAFHQEFQRQRPRDVNLAVAAGADEGEVTLFDVPAVNGWASSDAEVAAGHRAQGYEVAELRVPQLTLSTICAQYARGDVHFLKIDVEGFEGEVLRGMDFQRWRPWVLVIEATMPNSRVTNHERWENLVTSQQYEFAYFDGLNRYYVAAEHRALGDVMALQPNVFDDFIPWQLARASEGAAVQEAARQAEWEAHALTRAQLQAAGEALQREQAAHASTREALHSASAAHESLRQSLSEEYAAHACTWETLQNEYAAHAATRATRLDDERAIPQDSYQLLDCIDDANARTAEVEGLHAALQQLLADASTYALKLEADLLSTSNWALSLERQVIDMRNSRYWRLTAPLRTVTGSGVNRIAHAMRGLVRRTVTWLVSRESLRRLILPRLARVPWLAARVSRAVVQLKSAPPVPAAHARQAEVPPELINLPVSARRVLADLKRANLSKKP